MKYKVVLERNEEGFSVHVPGLPGCWSQGATEQEALNAIRDAVVDYLAVRDELVKDSGVREIDVNVAFPCRDYLGYTITMHYGPSRRRAFG